MHRFERLHDILKQALQQENYEAISQLETLKEYWQVVVGDNLALKTFPYKLKKRQLTVCVEDAAYSSSLQHKKEHLLTLINSLLQQPYGVTQIFFQVGNFPLFNKQPKPSGSSTPLPALDPSWQKRAEVIDDLKLRKSFLRWMQAVQKNQPSS